MIRDLQTTLVSRARILRRIRKLATEIESTYTDAEELTLISIINGAIPFTADLMRHLNIPVRLDCMRVSSYKNETSATTAPDIIDMLRLQLRDQHVLLIDDILDTGKTLSHVVEILKDEHPASLKVCVLLEKKGRREVEFTPDFVGFQIPDEFVVGYGLDFAERYRNLPCIGVLKPECLNPPEWR
jgi:hypoxanthine phosphoribosyltransferase